MAVDICVVSSTHFLYSSDSCRKFWCADFNNLNFSLSSFSN
uniref:Uncharacterized protein n=1 Tax=Arundo donax TaxID=35708 RepID=A0A0A9GC88_ARUDO